MSDVPLWLPTNKSWEALSTPKPKTTLTVFSNTTIPPVVAGIRVIFLEKVVGVREATSALRSGAASVWLLSMTFLLGPSRLVLFTFEIYARIRWNWDPFSAWGAFVSGVG